MDIETALRRMVEEEGICKATHMLADAFEKWADDEADGPDSGLRRYAAELRKLAGTCDA